MQLAKMVFDADTVLVLKGERQSGYGCLCTIAAKGTSLIDAVWLTVVPVLLSNSESQTCETSVINIFQLHG